jgi:hypothetical protein
MILLISTSRVARILGVSHRRLSGISIFIGNFFWSKTYTRKYAISMQLGECAQKPRHRTPPQKFLLYSQSPLCGFASWGGKLVLQAMWPWLASGGRK